MKPRYCIYCGKELEQELTGYFDGNTGEPLYRYRNCLVKDCKHGYHDFHRQTVFALFKKCRKCGESEII